MNEALCLGLISGTSADGVDAVLVRIDAAGRLAELVASLTLPYPDDLRNAVLACTRSDASLPLADLGRLDRRIGQVFAEAALAVCQQAGIAPADLTVIGSHGQTVFHAANDTPPHTLQIGDANTIAAIVGVPVVADFRRADIAAGGQGAPLAPGLHAAWWRDTQADQAVINLGGIANLTWLPADPETDVIAFDTGPANCLMDVWASEHLDAGMDAGGQWADSGRVDHALLDALLDEAYFARPPPKSTGREVFNREWLTPRLAGRSIAAADVQRTLLELTCRTLVDALHRMTPDHAPGRVMVCGGGAHNRALMARLAECLPAPVTTTDAAGLAPDWVEAVAFAWLAWRHLHRLPGNLPSVTGARRPVVLGGLYHAQPVPADR